MNGLSLGVLVSLLLIAAGCRAKSPDPLAAFQGDWQFDETGYLSSLRDRYQDTNTLKQMLKTHRDMKAYGMAPMPDIRIAGSRISSRDERPRVLYDLVDIRRQNDATAARAHFYDEERGTTITLDFLLEMRGTNLLFSRTEKGLGDTYLFKRK